MDIDEALLDAEEHFIKTVSDYDSFLKGIRTGQASPEILDNLRVEIASYGGEMQLKSVAVVSKQGNQMLIVKPFDPKTIKEIEKAINASDLGLNPVNDGKIIRLAFPPMSQERREQTVKIMKDRLEQHKIALRNIRKDAIHHIDQNDGKAGISEDMIAQAKEDVQDLLKKYEAELETHFERKAKEVRTV